MLTASRSGKSLDRAVIAYRASCESGQTFPFHAVVPVRRRAGGAVQPYGALLTSRNSRGRVAAQLFEAMPTTAGSAALQMAFSARLGARNSSGSFSAELTEIDQPGAEPATEAPAGAKVIDRCRTGRVAWRAVHSPGRVFGGSTSQSEPVVLEANARRSNIDAVGIGWHGPCTGSGFIDFPDVLTDFRVRRGRFGDVFTWEPEAGVSVAYDFGGSISSRTARGRLRVDVTQEGSGSCSTGPLTWRATSR